MSEGKDWLTVAEAASLLGIRVNRIYSDFKKGLEFDVNDSGIKIIERDKLENFYSPIQMIRRYAIASGDSLLSTQAALMVKQEEQIEQLKKEVKYLKEQLRIAHEEKTKLLGLLEPKNN